MPKAQAADQTSVASGTDPTIQKFSPTRLSVRLLKLRIVELKVGRVFGVKRVKKMELRPAHAAKPSMPLLKLVQLILKPHRPIWGWVGRA